MKTKTLIIAFFLALLLTGCGSSGKGFDPLGISPTGIPSTATAAPTAVATVSPTPPPSPTPVERWVVCTGYASGSLNVRSCPGVQCWAHDALYEGQEVVEDGKTDTKGGALWAHITWPVEGWVNTYYLCKRRRP